MPQYLVRLAQTHESFRRVELQALADVAGIVLQFVKYQKDVSVFLSLPVHVKTFGSILCSIEYVQISSLCVSILVP